MNQKHLICVRVYQSQCIPKNFPGILFCKKHVVISAFPQRLLGALEQISIGFIISLRVISFISATLLD